MRQFPLLAYSSNILAQGGNARQAPRSTKTTFWTRDSLNLEENFMDRRITCIEEQWLLCGSTPHLTAFNSMFVCDNYGVIDGRALPQVRTVTLKSRRN